MPIPTVIEHSIPNKYIREESNFDRTTADLEFHHLHAGLNSEQLLIFNTIINSCVNKQGGFYFVYGSGGTRKTYLWKTLINKLRSDGRLVLSIASSGIAALLLPGGRTAHSRFKIPLDVFETTACTITHQSELADLIRKAELIIWDEAAMIHRYAIEAVDRTLKDLLTTPSFDARSKVFGRKTTVLGGDFKQVLPVIPRGRREATVAACLQKSYLWKQCQLLHLTTNMRVFQHRLSSIERNEVSEFAQWLLDVGNGTLPAISIHNHMEADWIKIPNDMLILDNNTGVGQLISEIYPNLTSNLDDDTYLEQRAILAPKNDDVDHINTIMSKILPVSSRTYLSADAAVNKDTRSSSTDFMTTPEYLHSLNFPGIPKHCLELKVGLPVMLLRNLNASIGLCNGTRLVVVSLERRTIRTRIITGANKGDIHCIPIIVLSTSPP
ncbi:uncharacterized protein LOC143890438 [Tasmannia lanceolata]|uniref:uncharacterized protein LOC143890438 n=1 Tax=Tasmannia lanceolata TaxID=3420 RepID=UPI004062EB4E